MFRVGDTINEERFLSDYMPEGEKVMTVAIVTEDENNVARTYLFNREDLRHQLLLELIELTQVEVKN